MFSWLKGMVRTRKRQFARGSVFFWAVQEWGKTLPTSMFTIILAIRCTPETERQFKLVSTENVSAPSRLMIPCVLESTGIKTTRRRRRVRPLIMGLESFHVALAKSRTTCSSGLLHTSLRWCYSNGC